MPQKVLSQLARFFASIGRRRLATNHRWLFTPVIEYLEDRIAPADLYWTGKNSSDWGDKTNWNEHGAPASAPPGLLDTARFYLSNPRRGPCNSPYATTLNGTIGPIKGLIIVSSYPGTLTINGKLQVNGTFDMRGGTIAGPGTLQIIDAPTATWTGGTMSGSGITEVTTATLAIPNDYTQAAVVLDQGRQLQIDPDGGVDLNNIGAIQVNNGSVINNYGQFTARGGWIYSAAGAGSLFNAPRAQFINQAPTNPNTRTLIDVYFNNSGTVDVQGGTLTFTGGGTSSANFNTSVQESPVFGGGSWWWKLNTSFTGTGWSVLEAGNVTIPDGNIVQASYFAVSGGEINGKATFEIQCGLYWSGGAMRTQGGTTLIDSNAGVAMSGDIVLDSRTLTIQGSATISGTLRMNNGAVLQNFGTFIVFTGTDVKGTPTSRFLNYNAILTDQVLVRGELNVGILNFGVINVTAGVLKIPTITQVGGLAQLLFLFNGGTPG
jgi:hypothetical protein